MVEAGTEVDVEVTDEASDADADTDTDASSLSVVVMRVVEDMLWCYGMYWRLLPCSTRLYSACS